MWRRLWAWKTGLDVAVTRLLAMLLLLGACLLGFIALSDEVSEGETQDFDERVLRMLRDPSDPALPRGPWWLAVSAEEVTALGPTSFGSKNVCARPDSASGTTGSQPICLLLDEQDGPRLR